MRRLEHLARGTRPFERGAVQRAPHFDFLGSKNQPGRRFKHEAVAATADPGLLDGFWRDPARNPNNVKVV